MGNHTSQEVSQELSNSSLGADFIAQLIHVSRGKVGSHAIVFVLDDRWRAVGDELEGASAGSGERAGGRAVRGAASSAGADGARWRHMGSGGAGWVQRGVEGARESARGAVP